MKQNHFKVMADFSHFFSKHILYWRPFRADFWAVDSKGGKGTKEFTKSKNKISELESLSISRWRKCLSLSQLLQAFQKAFQRTSMEEGPVD